MFLTKHNFRWACKLLTKARWAYKQSPKLLCGLIPLLFLILTVVPVSFAGVDAMPHLRLGAGARSIGLGGAFTAIADDATATVWNPAGLGSAADLSLNFSTQRLSVDRTHNFIALTKALGAAGSIGSALTPPYHFGCAAHAPLLISSRRSLPSAFIRWITHLPSCSD